MRLELSEPCLSPDHRHGVFRCSLSLSGRVVLILLLCSVQAAAISQTAIATKRPAKKPPGPLLQIQDRQLFLGKLPYHNIGVTIPDLFARFLRGDDVGATQAMSDARSVNVRFVRCAGITSDADAFALFRTDPARWLSAFDRMLAAAHSEGLTLVPSLLYDRRTLPDYLRQTGKAGARDTDLMTAGTAANALAVDYIRAIVSRYRSDARILFWEVGNEYNRDADLAPAGDMPAAAPVTTERVRAFLMQIAGLIHQLDPRHLITSGNDDLRPDAWRLWQAQVHSANAAALSAGEERDTLDQYRQVLDRLNPPGIDIISVHQRPPQGVSPAWIVEIPDQALHIPWIQYATAQIGKPLFVGAFGQPVLTDGAEIAAPWMVDFMRRMQAEGSPLAALQDWEPATPDPAAAVDALSLQRTPRMAVALKVANAVIAGALATQATLAVGPPLEANERAVQSDRLHIQTALLRDIAIATVARLQMKPGAAVQGKINATGATLHLPGIGDPEFRVRDAAMLLGASLIDANETAGWVRLIAARQIGAQSLHFAHSLTVPPYSIPDHIALDGLACWYPDALGGDDQGSGSYGALPPADSAYYFIRMVREHLRLTGQPTLFRSAVTTGEGRAPLATVCVRAFDSVAVDARTGLVTCGETAGDARVAWGVYASVRETGLCLMPSLLRYQAARDLVDLFQAAGDLKQAAHYNGEAERIKAALPAAFYLPLGQTEGHDTGMLLAATVLGRKDDIWASAYAVGLNLLPADKQQAVILHLIALLKDGSTVRSGMVRPLPSAGPYGGAWEQCLKPPGEAENGAYGGLPVGWYVNAIAPVDPNSAISLLGDYLAFLQANQRKGAPWQWVDASRGSDVDPVHGASIVLPVEALSGDIELP